MEITIHPIAGLPKMEETSVNVDGDTITVDEVDYDLSPIPDGGYAEPTGDHPFVGRICREGGVLKLGLQYMYNPHEASKDQPQQNLVINITSGQLPDVVSRINDEEEL